MTVYLAIFALPTSSHQHHDGCGCGGHNHEHSHQGCCGGHEGHNDCKCDSHSEEPITGFTAFSKKVEELYPDFLPLFDSTWLINSDKNHQEIFQSLRSTIDSHSALWILPVPTESAGFLKPEALEWIKPRLYPNKK